ncbi:hypothetical protein HZA57_09230 [Candidatus Poribacteria bacterium]|nr:hypothetical protein [Candidatus Poribacteria bacterium]
MYLNSRVWLINVVSQLTAFGTVRFRSSSSGNEQCPQDSLWFRERVRTARITVALCTMVATAIGWIEEGRIEKRRCTLQSA